MGFVRSLRIDVRPLSGITTGLTVASLWKSPFEIAYLDVRLYKNVDLDIYLPFCVLKVS